MESNVTNVKIITNTEEIAACPKLPISRFCWNSLREPVSFGQLGCILGQGLAVRLTCQEASPPCTVTADNGPVYEDSALEFFFRLEQASGYFNFECNAAGAMLAMFGPERANRRFFQQQQLKLLHTKAWKEPCQWSVTFEIPFSLMEDFCPGTSLDSWKYAGIRTIPKKGRRTGIPSNSMNQESAPQPEFFFNLYKISEAREMEHYASYAPLQGETPDFHQPQCFTRAKLCLE